MPVVLIGCVPPSYDFPAVTQNTAAMMQEIVRYLTGLGHERIAFIGGVQEDKDPFRRDVGYENGLRDARLPYTASYRAYCRGTAEDGSTALEGMLDSLKPEYWPTAIIALNDLVAMGCMDVARKRGLSVPDQTKLHESAAARFRSFPDRPGRIVEFKGITAFRKGKRRKTVLVI
jgi:DNA-binding LacI/PurR family transcriptional regulator